LTRARVVAGDETLAADLGTSIRAMLSKRVDVEAVRKDVLDMRRLMLKELGTASIWDIKRFPGGLIDVEFIAQYLQLAHAAAHPEILDQNVAGALSKLTAAGLLSEADSQTLRSAHALYQRLTQLLRLCVETEFSAENAPPGLARLVANASAVPDIGRAEALLLETYAAVRAVFEGIVGPHEI
jgi:glutamate-ammonia-ligase adenylyltransferase